MGDNRTGRIAGRYRLLEQLGRGGMGVVWRARDTRLERDVAVKILHPWVAEDTDLRARFEREAAALARLEHPNVVRLYDVVEDDGRTALVMELIEGSSLSSLMGTRVLGWDEARTLTAPIAAGLAHAHARGVVHRDLTPANVLVERSTGRLVVTDFGLARLARGGTVPVSGVLAGTPEYWAPEQAAGRATGPSTDLYALGLVLFRMLAGELPFTGEDRLAVGLRRAHEDAPPLSSRVAGAPTDACALVDALLARDPTRRPDAIAAARALGADPATLPGRVTRARTTAHASSDETLVTLELETRLWPGETELPTLPAAPARPTPVVEPAASSPAVPAVRARARPTRRRGRRRTALALVAAMLALTLGGVYAVASDPPSGIDAPDVLGRGVDAARDDVLELARRDGLPAPKVKIVDRQYSESVPAGRIIQQDPAPGTRITSGGALLLAVSKGSAYAPVPSVAGLESSRAVATLERAGFVTARKFSPSREIAAWHAIDTDPAPDTRVKRPATVTILVSTGPPRVAIPQVRGLDVETAAETLREAGFVPVVEERASGEAPGAILGLRPAGGTRIPVGSTVTIVVAREPVWTAVTELTGEGSTTFDQITIPAGSRLRIETDDTSFLDLAGARLSVTWVGDANGGLDLDGGDGAVLVDAGHSARTVEVTLTAEGPVRWRLVVEEPR